MIFWQIWEDIFLCKFLENAYDFFYENEWSLLSILVDIFS